MIVNKLKSLVGHTDIYLLDQFLKGRIQESSKVLDAGCGTGRNLHLLLKNNIDFSAFDSNENRIQELKTKFPELKESFIVSTIEEYYSVQKFDFIICNAVLHFSESHKHFDIMFASLMNLLSNTGILFIRMTSNFGIENEVIELKNGVYSIPDGSKRYLLTANKTANLIKKHNLEFIEPLKTVNVNNLRCMSTLVLGKTISK